MNFTMATHNARGIRRSRNQRRMRPILLALALAGFAAGQPGPKPNVLTISAAPSLVTFALKPSGIAPGSAPILITTTWEIQKGGTNVHVNACFTAAASALSGPGGNIPSSRVFGRIPPNPFIPFTGTTACGAGTSVHIFDFQVRSDKRDSRTDTLEMQIDTTGLNLSPGSYSGVLRIHTIAI